ncbi:MAG: hemerythrin family protein [Rhodocyclaceae bacterium]
MSKGMNSGQKWAADTEREGGDMFSPRTIDHGLMDAEHLALGHWVQAAVEGSREGHALSQALDALDALRRQAASHFEHESEDMRATGYPQRKAHAHDHEAMLDELLLIRQAVTGLEGPLNVEKRSTITERLLCWFHGHIERHDRPLAAWLGQRTAPPDTGSEHRQ